MRLREINDRLTVIRFYRRQAELIFAADKYMYSMYIEAANIMSNNLATDLRDGGHDLRNHDKYNLNRMATHT